MEIVKFLTCCQKKYKEVNNTGLNDDFMKQVFKDHPSHRRLYDVAVKVIAVAQVYKATVYDHSKMAHHICRLKNLKSMISDGEGAAVEAVRFGHGIIWEKSRKEIDFYSFSTKYCHWSNPNRYPMYDQYVQRAVREIRERTSYDFAKGDFFKDYIAFRGQLDMLKFIIISPFYRKSSWGYGYKELDEALWVYGRYLKGNLPVKIQNELQGLYQKL